MESMEVEHASLLVWAFSLVMPAVFMSCTIPSFFLAALLNPQLTLSLNISKLQEKSFWYAWRIIGRPFADDFPSPGLDQIINDKCNGRVLDIGPGAGFQLKRFRGPQVVGHIEEVYAVEPGTDMHDQLRAEAIKVFGGDAPNMYRILSCGAQPEELLPKLIKEGILDHTAEGVFDTIVSIRALCGIPDPQGTADLFYRLLKPGGKIIFFEHVANSGNWKRHGSPVAKSFQQFYMMLGWSFWNGGCCLTRDTALTLRKAAAPDGGWAEEKVIDRKPEGCIPEIWGYMQKK